MTDWADIIASDLLQQHAVMRGDKIAVLNGIFERALASKLRVVRMAARIETGQEAETVVRALYARAAS